MLLRYAIICIMAATLNGVRAGDCSCGTCQVVDCDEGEKTCQEFDGESSCVSGGSDWVCKLDDGCSESDCEKICEDSSCYAASCDISDNVCFHETSEITYKNKVYNFAELLDGSEPECVVPHTPLSTGVRISTNCGQTFRVTGSHLIATTNGYQPAHRLAKGDIVYAGFGEGKECTVTSTEKDSVPESFFGLNCVHSVVLVDGIRASTFGDFHFLPAFYMRYVGSILGIRLASWFGDFLAKSLFYLHSKYSAL